MSLLLDTHILLWWLSGDRRLSKRARTLIEAADVAVTVSVVSLWETAIKAALKRKRAVVDPLELYQGVLDGDFELLAIGPLHAIGVASLPPHHGDPFDRMLVAQAKAERLTLVTHDKTLSSYDVAIEVV